MKKFWLLSLFAVAAVPAHAVLVDFEGAPDLAAIPAGYGGLNWNVNSYALNSSTYTPNPSGYQNCTVSGVMVGFSAFAVNFGFETTDLSNFTTLSFWLGAAWEDGLTVHIDALDGGLGGSVIATSDVTVSSTGPTQFFMNGGISGMTDAWLFTPTTPGTNHGWGGSGSHLVMDDIEYSTVVPEPATMAVLGLGALALIRRRRSK